MGTAAQFPGKIAHGYHTHLVGILFTEQCHGSGFFRFLQTHDLCRHRKIGLDFLIDQRLCPGNLFLCHGLKMGKVKPQTIRCNQRTLLFYVGSQNRFQRFLQQVGGAVIFGGIQSFFPIHTKGDGIARFQHAAGHDAHMADLSAAQVDGILYLEGTLVAADHAHISLLTAHGAVERRHFGDDGSPLAFHQTVCQLLFCG